MNFNLENAFETAFELLAKFPNEYFGLIKNLNTVHPEFSLKLDDYTFQIKTLGSCSSRFGHAAIFEYTIRQSSETIFKLKFIKNDNGNITIQNLLLSTVGDYGTFEVPGTDEFIFPQNSIYFIHNSTLHDFVYGTKMFTGVSTLINTISSKINNNV